MNDPNAITCPCAASATVDDGHRCRYLPEEVEDELLADSIPRGGVLRMLAGSPLDDLDDSPRLNLAIALRELETRNAMLRARLDTAEREDRQRAALYAAAELIAAEQARELAQTRKDYADLLTRVGFARAVLGGEAA